MSSKSVKNAPKPKGQKKADLKRAVPPASAGVAIKSSAPQAAKPAKTKANKSSKPKPNPKAQAVVPAKKASPLPEPIVPTKPKNAKAKQVPVANTAEEARLAGALMSYASFFIPFLRSQAPPGAHTAQLDFSNLLRVVDQIPEELRERLLFLRNLSAHQALDLAEQHRARIPFDQLAGILNCEAQWHAFNPPTKSVDLSLAEHTSKAEAFIGQRQFSEALEACNRGLRIQPPDLRLLWLRAQVEAELAESRGETLLQFAREDCEDALQIDPKHSDIRQLLVQVLQRLDRIADAEMVANAGLKLDPRDGALSALLRDLSATRQSRRDNSNPARDEGVDFLNFRAETRSLQASQLDPTEVRVIGSVQELAPFYAAQQAMTKAHFARRANKDVWVIEKLKAAAEMGSAEAWYNLVGSPDSHRRVVPTAQARAVKSTTCGRLSAGRRPSSRSLTCL